MDATNGVTVRVFPSLIAKMLHKKTRISGKPADTIGRLWLILHHISQRENTSGAVVEEAIREELTSKNSPLRIGGERHLRDLLKHGDNVLWVRSAGRIWLRGVKKVCLALDVQYLDGRMVEVPLEKLCGPIVDVRAWFMVAFLGGRKDQDRPISRQVIKQVTGVGKRTQRKYQKQTKTKSHKNTAVLYRYSPHSLQRARIHLHLPAYRKGKNVVFRMGNSYTVPACVQQVHNRRTRAINKRLAQCNNPGDGNGRKLTRWYYDSEIDAHNSWEKNGREVYGRKSKRRWAVFLCQESEQG